MSFPRRQGLAILSGLLLALSFPKFGHWAVAWLALLPLLLALAPGGRSFRLAYLAGVVAALGVLYWTALVVIQFGGLSLPVAIGVMLLLCLAVALFTGLAGWLIGRWLAAFGPLALLLAPVAWVASEILRAHTLYRFSWCLLGYSQQQNLPAIQIASVTAVYGVSFVVVFASSALAYLIVESRPARRLGAAIALVVGLGSVLGYGLVQLARPLPESPRLRVGLVQASIRQEDKWAPGRAMENVERHVELTRRAAAAGARLVVWPESALPFLFDRTPSVAAWLRRLASEHGIYLLFGNDDREEGPKPRVFVGAKLLTPDGEVALRYHKVRLVPFGEYVPLQPLLTLGGRHSARLVQGVADFAAGSEYGVARVDGHALCVFICYEAIFPDLAREFSAGGADLLVNITNDAWYGRSSAPHQHLAQAAFRAVENGKYLVRAANTGISAIVDPRGRVLARTPLFEPALVVEDVPVVAGRTFYSRHGDVFAWGCFGGAVALTLLASLQRPSAAT